MWRDSPTKPKTAAAKAAAPAAEGTTGGAAKKGAPGFTTASAGCGTTCGRLRDDAGKSAICEIPGALIAPLSL